MADEQRPAGNGEILLAGLAAEAERAIGAAGLRGEFTISLLVVALLAALRLGASRRCLVVGISRRITAVSRKPCG
jgi:hypothetical protein